MPAAHVTRNPFSSMHHPQKLQVELSEIGFSLFSPSFVLGKNTNNHTYQRTTIQQTSRPLSDLNSVGVNLHDKERQLKSLSRLSVLAGDSTREVKGNFA